MGSRPSAWPRRRMVSASSPSSSTSRRAAARTSSRLSRGLAAEDDGGEGFSAGGMAIRSDGPGSRGPRWSPVLCPAGLLQPQSTRTVYSVEKLRLLTRAPRARRSGSQVDQFLLAATTAVASAMAGGDRHCLYRGYTSWCFLTQGVPRPEDTF